MKVGELFIALGFQVDSQKLKDFNEGIKSGTKLLGAMGAVAGTAVYAVNRFVASSVDSSVKLSNMTQQIGVASDEVQRFYNVAGRKNPLVTLDDTINMYTQLADTIAQAKLGQGPLGEAGMLGLDNIGNMTPTQVFMELRKNFQTNKGAWGQGDERVIQNLMKAIGVGPEYIGVIKATDEEFDRLYANPILNGDARQKLEDLAKTTKEFDFQWELLKGNLSAEISPGLIEFMTNLNAVMGEASEKSGALSTNIEKFQTKSGLNDDQMRTVGNAGAVGAGLTLMAIPSPFFATQAAGALVIGGAAVNDAGKYIRGKPSTTGDLIQHGGDGISDFFGGLKNAISEELMKTKEEQEEDRRHIRNGEPYQGGFGKYGVQSSQTNHIYVSSTSDPRTTAITVMDEADSRKLRQNQVNLQVSASGMNL